MEQQQKEQQKPKQGNKPGQPWQPNQPENKPWDQGNMPNKPDLGNPVERGEFGQDVEMPPRGNMEEDEETENQ